ncbi:hypothetical protein SARC_08020 [Sphaeroforma arctica JP610]|uniref:Uncharacterized protein n=1 Tax=Sphaeroforma arctica JP610 TaxID=667725 RepID=A0A0L0FS28_9EUKA|nr:hypothetical protein SARC_08020 [Sphaeroforma arctica JP610]KNC79587.1 hypothetical protein SARC_08020 [Sphaeroforma arctica JP610]|eukprot:XP_014153489.1 hypothetical protein SARC_08020 [Sphaeroforma arctica JP610]
MPPKKKAAAVVVSSDSEVEIVPKKKISAKAKAKPVGANPFAIAVGKKKANNPFTAAASATSKASATKKPTKTKKAEALRVESDDDDTYKPSPVKLNRKKRSDDASAFFSDNSDSDFDPGTEKAESSEEEAAPM